MKKKASPPLPVHKKAGAVPPVESVVEVRTGHDQPHTLADQLNALGPEITPYLIGEDALTLKPGDKIWLSWNQEGERGCSADVFEVAKSAFTIHLLSYPANTLLQTPTIGSDKPVAVLLRCAGRLIKDVNKGLEVRVRLLNPRETESHEKKKELYMIPTPLKFAKGDLLKLTFGKKAIEAGYDPGPFAVKVERQSESGMTVLIHWPVWMDGDPKKGEKKEFYWNAKEKVFYSKASNMPAAFSRISEKDFDAIRFSKGAKEQKEKPAPAAKSPSKKTAPAKKSPVKKTPAKKAPKTAPKKKETAKKKMVKTPAPKTSKKVVKTQTENDEHPLLPDRLKIGNGPVNVLVKGGVPVGRFDYAAANG